jgi:hypothetical protein
MRRHPQLRAFLTVTVLILLIIGTWTGMTRSALNTLGLNRLHRQNREYLQSAMTRSLTTFAVLSGIKVGLAVLEGSELGVGFGLEVGDAVQSAYDYVDVAWRALLASSAILMGTQFLLETTRFLEPVFLTATLMICLVIQLFGWIRPQTKNGLRPLRDLALFTGILTFAMMLLLPLSIRGGSRLSAQITEPSLKQADADLLSMRSDLFPGGSENTGVIGKLKDAKNAVEQVSRLLIRKTQDLSMLLLKIIAGYIFDTIVFPLALFILYFYLTRIAAGYLFNLQRERSLREDLDTLLRKYFKPEGSSS